MGSGIPTYMAGSTFLGLPQLLPASKRVVAGIPFDLGTSNRPGARFGPQSIRHASRMLVDGHHPYHSVDLKLTDFWDIGDFGLVQGDIIASLERIQQQASIFDHIIALGGDHTISLPLLRALKEKIGKPIGLLHFDAHIDTWPDNFGGLPYGHGNPFYHALEEGLVEPTKMMQIGIRSPCDSSVMEWTKQKGSSIISGMDFHTKWTIQQITSRIGYLFTDYPVYLSIDVDVLDPSVAPGTGTPETGGLQMWQLQYILRHLGMINFVGMDVVEVSPPYDISEITSLAAATLAWEYMCLLESKR